MTATSTPLPSDTSTMTPSFTATPGVTSTVDLTGTTTVIPTLETTTPGATSTVDLTGTAGHERLVALDHRRDLFRLVRMDDENNFVMAHEISFWI